MQAKRVKEMCIKFRHSIVIILAAPGGDDWHLFWGRTKELSMGQIKKYLLPEAIETNEGESHLQIEKIFETILK